MRKLKLLLVTLALIVGGVGSAWADPVGVTVQTGTYYLYNIGAKKYMTVGQIWGSRANVSESEALPVQITAGSADGTFKIISKLNGNSNGLFIDGTPAPFLDNGSPIDLIFDKQGENNVYKIKDGSSQFIKWDGTNDALIAGAADASGDNDKWIVTTEDNMKADLITRMGTATDVNPVNVTLFVKSARPAWGTSSFWPYTNWTNGNSENDVDRHSGGSAAVMGYWGGSGKDIYQEITVPKGKYKVRCLGFARAGDWSSNYCWEHKDGQNSEVYISSAGNSDSHVLPSIFDGAQTSAVGDGNKEYDNDGGTNKYIPNNCKSAAIYFSQHKYTTWAEATTTVEDGTVRIGVRNPSSQWEWVEVSQFELLYLEPVVSVNAIDLPVSGDIVADQWYKYSVASTGTYKITAGTAANIVQTTNGDQLISTATGSAITTGENVNLTSGDVIYYKSNSDNTLTIEANTKTYSVGDVTSTSITGTPYLQSMPATVTFTLGGATTNDGSAVLTVQGEATAILNDGTSNVATGELSPNTETKVVTATFDYAIQPGKTYKIILPANAIAWDKDNTNKNTEKVITFMTPAVFDGHYYIKKDGADLYFSRGGDENKQTVLDAYGIPVKITTNESNMSRVKFIDTDLLLGASGSSNMYWTDKSDGTPSTVNWTIAKNGNKYKFYLDGMGDDKKGMNIHTNGTEPKSDTEANACDWELELPAVHKAKLQAIKDTQAADVATSVGITGVSTQAEMATKLAADFGTTNITITGTGGTNREAWQKSAHRTTNDEYAVFNEETVSDLKPGLYRLRVHGFERITNGQAVYDAGGAAGLAYVYATSNGATEKVKLASLFDVQSDTQWKTGNDLQFGGKYYPNGQEGAQAAFNAEKYANDVYVKVVDEGSGTGSIKFGIKQPNCYYQGSAENPLARAQWICYNNFSLTLFEAKATADEKTALANAITAAGAKTLGFETGEYAPYANAAALEALAAAKAIDPENASGTSVVAATTALTSATWTANASEKNAIAYGDLSSYETVGGKDYPYGWSKYDDGSRIMGGSEGTTNAGLSASSTGKAMLVKYNAKYGEQVGYTMPLKAGQLYKICFNYCGWGNNPTTNVVIKKPNGTSVTVENASFKPATNDGNSDAAHWYEYTGSFTADVAGDYVLELNKVETGQQQIAWADMQLVKTQEVSANMTITSAKYATFIAPFDVAIPSGIIAYKVLAAEDKTLSMTPVETTIPANTPVVLNKDVTGDDFTQDFNGADRSTKNTYTVGLLTGVYADTPATPGTYVLQNQSGTVAFYKVTSGNEPTVGKNRAYVNAGAFGAGIKAFFFDEDETTAIESLDALTSGEYDAIYNAAGIQVEALQKGLNIVVKDGKSYKIYVK